jgi:hypothetical protein
MGDGMGVEDGLVIRGASALVGKQIKARARGRRKLVGIVAMRV